jgi:hypothetical protein
VAEAVVGGEEESAGADGRSRKRNTKFQIPDSRSKIKEPGTKKKEQGTKSKELRAKS